MKTVNLVTLGVTVAGGLNWGLVAWFGHDLVSVLFGVSSLGTRLVYLGIALAALYQILPLWLAIRLDEPAVQADRVA